MDYKLEKCLKIAALSVGITLIVYLILGSVLIFTIYGGTKTVMEKADFQALMNDFTTQLSGCYDTFVMSDSAEYREKQETRSLFLSCSGESASLFGVTLAYPFLVSSKHHLSLLHSSTAAIGLTLSFDESYICVSGESEELSCQMVTSVYSLLGVLINLLFAILIAILSSSRLTFIVTNLPFVQIYKQICALIIVYITFELLLIALLSALLHFVSLFVAGNSTHFFSLIAQVTRYFTFSGASYDTMDAVQNDVIVDLCVKIVALINGHVLLVIICTCLKLVVDKFETAHQIATMGSSSTCTGCHRPRKATDPFSGTLSHGTLTLPFSSEHNHHNSTHNYRSPASTLQMSPSDHTIVANSAPGTQQHPPPPRGSNSNSPNELSNKSSGSEYVSSSAEYSEHQFNGDNGHYSTIRSVNIEVRDYSDCAGKSGLDSDEKLKKPSREDGGGDCFLTPDHPRQQSVVPLHEIEQLYNDCLLLNDNDPTTDFDDFFLPVDRPRLVEEESCRNSSTSSQC